MDKVSSRHVAWIDIESPDEQKIADLVQRYGIHPLAAQELLVTTYRPKLEDFDDHLYLVLHFPLFDRKTHATRSREVDFVIFPYTLITVHYEDVPQLDQFQEFLGGHEAIRERTFGRSSGKLLYHIIGQLFTVSKKELEEIEDKIEIVQERVFSGKEKEVLADIAFLRRDLLSFQRALKPQQAVLASLAEYGKRFFGDESVPYFHDINGEYQQVWNVVQDLRETLDVIYETNISLLSANTNEAMKVLTAVSFIFLPLQVILNVFGMNIDKLPLADNPDAFWVITGINFFVAVIIATYLRRRKWL